MNTPISLLLARKGADVASIDLEASVFDAVTLMNQRRIGAVLVTDETLQPCGIFSERDILVRVVGAGLDPRATKVADVMTKTLVEATLSTTVDEAMELFMRHRIRHLPVRAGDELAGLISIGDVNLWLLVEGQTEARHLRCYIHGDPACVA